MLIDKLYLAFKGRQKPKALVESNELTGDEISGIESIGEKKWNELTGDMLEKHPDAINLMAPEAFCYYLPGVILASIKENSPNLMAAVSVVSALDRTPVIELWDSHFLKRWPSLRGDELAVISEWILWLEGNEFALDEISLIRALENIDLLKAQVSP
jgi:hypothetical protein